MNASQVGARCVALRACFCRIVCLFALAVSFQAYAMQPCPTSGECIDEASAYLTAPADVLAKACSGAEPRRSHEYTQALAHVFRGEDTRFLEKLRASEVYAHVKAEIESKMSRFDPVKLRESCEHFLKENG